MLEIEYVESADPALNLAVLAQEVGSAQSDRGVHARKKRIRSRESETHAVMSKSVAA